MINTIIFRAMHEETGDIYDESFPVDGCNSATLVGFYSALATAAIDLCSDAVVSGEEIDRRCAAALAADDENAFNSAVEQLIKAETFAGSLVSIWLETDTDKKPVLFAKLKNGLGAFANISIAALIDTIPIFNGKALMTGEGINALSFLISGGRGDMLPALIMAGETPYQRKRAALAAKGQIDANDDEDTLADIEAALEAGYEFVETAETVEAEEEEEEEEEEKIPVERKKTAKKIKR